MRIPQLIAIACLSCTPTALFAQTPDDTTLTSNPVYEKNCAKCHGKSAEGRHFGGPSLVTEKTIATPADDLRNIITNGKGHMPKYSGRLSAEEIEGWSSRSRPANQTSNRRKTRPRTTETPVIHLRFA
jgi:mono/diheme cytochrome c family protein